MSRILIKTLLHNKKENKFYSNEVIGIKTDKIKFITEQVMNILSINENIVTLKRKCDEYEIEMIFDKDNISEGKYFVKTLGYFNLKVKTKELIIRDDSIEIDYIMSLEDVQTEFSYKLDWRTYDK